MKKYIQEITLSDYTTAGKIFRLVGKNKEVLEIGCASGVQSRLLKEQLGCTITAVEIDEQAAKSAEQYCSKVFVGNIENIEINKLLVDKKFDVILFADVLEHLTKPIVSLLQVRDLIKKQGFIVASVPNITHSSVVYQMTKGVFQYQEFGLLDDTHVKFFSKDTLCRMFENAGMKIEQIDRVFCSPTSSELNINVRSKNDVRILKKIIENNPEALTYQFVIKATVHDPIEQYPSFSWQKEDVDKYNAVRKSFFEKTRKKFGLRGKVYRLFHLFQGVFK